LDIAIEWEGDPRFQSKHAHVSDDLIRLIQAVELACSTNRTVIPPTKGGKPLPAFLPENFFERRVVAIHPAAGTPTRQWPAQYFSQLIDLLIEDHDVNIALIGGPDETEIADEIIGTVRHQERVVSCLGKMKLIETTEFLPSCALFVGNNSGPSHIAAALGVPTVAVHSGVIASEEWGPYGPAGVAIRRDMSCAPCYIAKPDDCPRSLACLHHLGAGEVLKVCSGFLATP
jgi:O-antigen biosynthesis protein